MSTFRLNNWTLFNLSSTVCIIVISSIILRKLYSWHKRKSFLQMKSPKIWKCIGTLEEITIYPIKSCSGIDIESAKCNILGLERYENIIDRKFAILNKNTGNIISARQYPKMLTIKTEIDKDLITVTAPNMDNLKIHLKELNRNSNVQETCLWGSKVLVTKCGFKYDEWFSKFLFNSNEGACFVQYNFNEPTKSIIPMLKDENFLNSDTGALQDASSYMLINQQSIDDLNTRLKDKVHHRQFRPNFLIKTNGPSYAEDHWNWIKIGENVVFRVIAPSYRCILTTLNHLTGEHNQNNEPLRTLNKYRIWGKQKYPRMGVLLGLGQSGIIRKGDNVFIGISE